MDVREFGIGQVKKEVDSEDFNKASQRDILKNVDYSYQDLSTNECNSVQIKKENCTDTFRENIKSEVVEENRTNLYRFCKVCNKSSNSETNSNDLKNELFGCSCEDPDYSNQSEKISQDVKPFSLDCTTDSRLQLIKVKDETISDNECDNKQVSLSAPPKAPGPLLENVEKPTPTNIPDDLFRLKRIWPPESVQNDLFVKHRETDELEKRRQCKFCSKSFADKIDLKVHERIGHLDDVIECKVCWKVFSRRSDLTLHLVMHNRVSHYQCQICKKPFQRSQSLKKHLEVHVEEKTIRCKFCPESFATMRRLNGHLNVHVDREQLRCKVCSKTLSSSKALKEHETIHSGEKPFSCKVCPRFFRSLGTLRVHNKTHTRGPYQCKFCPQSFISRQNMNLHEWTHAKK